MPRLLLLMLLMVVVGCGTDKGRVLVDNQVVSGAPPKVTPLAGAPVMSVSAIDAPGFNVNDLTARLRDALVHTSGVPVVDELSVRAEIAACVEMPCKDTEQQKFQNAKLVASATVSRVGSTLIGSLRIQEGVREIARVNAQGADAGVVIDQLGFQGGAQLRAALTPDAPDAAPVTSDER